MSEVQFAWHVHHARLLEPLTKPLEIRDQYIRDRKPLREREVRLRLLRLVKGTLPSEVVEAGKAYVEAEKARDEAEKAYIEGKKPYIEGKKPYIEARMARDKAWKAWDEAWKAWDEVTVKHRSAIDALHAAECPECPWDGWTIFPE